MNICLDCGLCCDGTMFQDVALDEQDRLRLEAVGVSFAYGTASFPQPCWAATSRGCSIYDSRPLACRTERCLLLRRWEAGDVPYDEARALIVSTIALRDRVRPQIQRYVGSEMPEDLGNLYRQVVDKLDRAPDPAAEKRDCAQLLLAVGALRQILADHFEAPENERPFRDPK